MARGWKLAGVGRSGDSELGLAWDLAVEHARGTRSPPGALVGFGEARSSATMAALGGEVSQEQAVRGFPGGYGLPKLAYRGRRRC